MRFCPNCGRQVDDSANECHFCGHAMPKENPQSTGYEMPDAQEQSASFRLSSDFLYPPPSPYEGGDPPHSPPFDPVPPLDPNDAPYKPMGAANDTDYTGMPEHRPPSRNDSGKSKSIVIVIMAVIIAVLVAVVLFLTLRGGKKKAKEAASAENNTLTAAVSMQRAEGTTQKTIVPTAVETTAAAPTTAVPTMTHVPATATPASPQVSVPATVPTTLPPQTAPTPPPPYTPQQTEYTELIVNLNTAAGSGTILNIRSGPGMNYPVIDQIQNGARVHRLAQSGNWSYIDFGTGRGWCDTSVAGFVSAGSSSGETVVVRLNQAAGSGPILNVRSGPGSEYDVIAQIPDGSVVTRYRQENGWSYINYGSGYGWVNTSVAGF